MALVGSDVRMTVRVQRVLEQVARTQDRWEVRLYPITVTAGVTCFVRAPDASEAVRAAVALYEAYSAPRVSWGTYANGKVELEREEDA